MTSALTLLETLVIPYRTGDAALAQRYDALLTRGKNLRLVDIDRPLLHATAQLRARYRIKTPDRSPGGRRARRRLYPVHHQ